MSDEEFQILALKALKRETSPEEQSALELVLAQEPERREEFEDLREALAITEATLPLTSALEATEPELPRYRLAELESAVHAHFKEAPEETESWWSTWWPRLVLGSGAVAAVCAIAFLLITPGPTGIEVGFYSEPLTRSDNSGSLTQIATETIHVNTFDTDSAFEDWLAKPFEKNEKAKIWLDEEHDLVHVRQRGYFFGTREYTVPLPATAAERQATLQAVIEPLKK